MTTTANSESRSEATVWFTERTPLTEIGAVLKLRMPALGDPSFIPLFDREGCGVYASRIEFPMSAQWLSIEVRSAGTQTNSSDQDYALLTGASHEQVLNAKSILDGLWFERPYDAPDGSIDRDGFRPTPADKLRASIERALPPEEAIIFAAALSRPGVLSTIASAFATYRDPTEVGAMSPSRLRVMDVIQPEVEKLEALIEFASPGEYMGMACDCEGPTFGVVSLETGREVSRVWNEADARFGAATSPAAISRLLDAYRRMQDKVALLEYDIASKGVKIAETVQEFQVPSPTGDVPSLVPPSQPMITIVFRLKEPGIHQEIATIKSAVIPREGELVWDGSGRHRHVQEVTYDISGEEMVAYVSLQP
jgi:hypothetical protein